ncbi:MAG: ABC transporter ATP-binding protein [bacterium]|nr:ABC transporter ATP-binding protein [bacterium]
MLEVDHLGVRYGKILAVQDISLQVAQGDIVALIGTNGAGKSSIMKAICGIEPVAAGQIHYLGEEITGLPSHKIIKRGIVQVPEGRLIFKGLTVRENLLLGGHSTRNRAALGEEISRLLEIFPMLQNRLNDPCSSLSGGQTQMLALARGLMARPKLLLLDEPSLGLAPLAVQEVLKLIKSLKKQGVTILLVEQNVRQALVIADRGYILEGGRIILEDKAKQLLNHDLLVHSYLGIQNAGGGYEKY